MRAIELICEISASFIDLPATSIDDGINTALRVLGAGLDIDRTWVGVFSADRSRATMTHQWVADDVPLNIDAFRAVAVSDLPWLLNEALANRPTVIDRIADLPAAADAERETVRRFGTRSLVVLPLTVARSTFGMVGFGMVRQERSWTDETVASLQLVAEIIANALERKRVDEALHERLRFEELVTDLSTGLLQAPMDEVDPVLRSMLARVAAQLDFRRAALVLLNDARNRLEVTHEWLAEGSASFDRGDGFAVPEFGWPFDLVLAGQAVLARREDVPMAAVAARRLFETPANDTHGVVPITIGGSVAGCVVFSSGRHDAAFWWQYLPRLKLLGEMLAGARARQRAEVARKLAFEELSRLKSRIELERDYLREEVAGAARSERIIGNSAEVRAVLGAIGAVATCDATVLLLGESGVGKELFAQAVHAGSRRCEGPLVRVNCAAVPKELFESEFFGHVKGAFTGAVRDRVGRFELANGGTLFLDEVGEIPLDLQSKLLRVLQEGEFERVGDDRTRRVDVRVVAATNRDLERDVANGRFRQDLYYRLSVFPIQIPPLRGRPDDIVPIANHYLRAVSRRLGRDDLFLSEADASQLRSYDWPGNIRELQNVIERAVILSRGGPLQLGLALPPRSSRMVPSSQTAPSAASDPNRLLTSDQMRDLERENLWRALEKSGFRVSGSGGAAELLGVRPSTLRDRMKALGIAKRERS